MDHIDLNCDLGELESDAGLLLDSTILPLITSASVACGAHAGSMARMRQLAALCRSHDVGFGAHPGYPDRANFGRHVMPMSAMQIREFVREQILLAARIAESEGILLSHVKPHGALYNLAAQDADVANAIAIAVTDVCAGAHLVALSGSQLIKAGQYAGLVTVSEVFADRNYHADGSLVSRQHPDAVLHDAKRIALRAVEMIQSQSVTSVEGTRVPILAETICVHGDTPNAMEITRLLRRQLESSGIRVHR